MSTTLYTDSDIEFNNTAEGGDNDAIDKSAEEETLPAWKRILHLPFEPIWSNLLLTIACVQVAVAVFAAGFERYGKKQQLDTNFNFRVFKYLSDIMYLCDILLIIACKNIRELFICPVNIRIPTWVLLMDFVSILPFEVMVPMDPLTPIRERLYYIVQLNDCLKIARIYFIIYHNHIIVGNNKIGLQLFEFCFNMTMIMVTALTITYNVVCYTTVCEEPLSSEKFVDFLYIAVSRITTKGFADYPDNLFWMFIFTLGAFITLSTVTCINIAHFTVIIFNKHYHKYTFLSKLYITQKRLKNFQVSDKLKEECLHFFYSFWEKRSGSVDNPKFFLILPPTMQEEIALDKCWLALKHSKLFRDMDLPFLRYTSTFFRSKFAQPGEVLYDKNALKSMMIYVESGVVQILSEEDGETPILSFSGGTCLGEIGLMLCCKSKATVCCKTFCELQILRKSDFVKVVKKFPMQCLQLRRVFKNRLLKAREFHDLTEMINAEEGVSYRKDIKIMMLKSTLHRLMVRDGDTSTKHECQNIFLRSEFKEENFVNMHFSALNLDMLAISERLELVTDTVFLKTSCPCILQPNSMILKVWDIIIMMLAVFISLLIPYFAFVEPDTSAWYVALLYIITIVWWLDIYIQSSVAVKTADEIIATVKTIFLYRMNTTPFLIDLSAAAPLEVLSCIFLPYVSGQTLAILHLNRILKLWVIHEKFQKWSTELHDNANLICYLKYCCYSFYLIYFSSCLLFSLDCFNFVCIHSIAAFDINLQLLWLGCIIIQILTGTSLKTPYSNIRRYYPVYILLNLVSCLTNMLICSNVAALYCIRHIHQIRVREILKDMLKMMDTYRLTHKYRTRILNYIRTQWDENYASVLLHHRSVMAEVPKSIRESINEESNAKLILTCPLFKILPDELVLDLCTVSDNIILPPNEVITYAGEVCDAFYIIRMGYCKMISEVSEVHEKILGSQNDVAVIETCLHLPAVNTVITITHCRLLKVTYTDFMRIFSKFPHERAELEVVFMEIKLNPQLGLLSHTDPSDTRSNLLPINDDTSESFCKFGYNLQLDSFEEYDYYIPFDRLGIFSFVQYFLLRFTILPQGKFIYRWEIIRCVCAFLSAVVFSVNFLSTCTDCEWFFFVVLLDSMAWIDMYVRLHICYYNKKGILVTHPLKTATRYLTGAFLMDFFAVFPVHLLLNKSTKSYNKSLAYLQLNRVIQMYRYLGFFKYIKEKSLLFSVFTTLIKYVPILIVICFFVGALVVNYACVFDENIKNPEGHYLGDGIRCIKRTANKFTKPISATTMQAMTIYMITTIFTQSGILGFVIALNNAAIGVTVITVVGYIFSLYILSITMTVNTLQDSTLLRYQASLKCVQNFMQNYDVNLELRRNFVKHFQLKWQRKRGKDVHECIVRFNRALQQDILYDVYGSVLEDTWIFYSDSKAFLRDLLLEVSHDTILMDAPITTVNDVNRYLHILFNGEACVLAADGTKLATLTVGSVFGNLDDCEMARQMVSVVATTNAEILTIESLRFHANLNNYPRLQKRYKFLTVLHMDYLESREQFMIEQESSFIQGSDVNAKNSFKGAFTLVFDPRSRSMRLWQIIILIFVCYIEIFISVYQMALSTYQLGFVIFQYFCDLLYVVNYYVKTHTAYENDFGIIIKDQKMIKNRMQTNKIRYWCEIISLIPLDILVWPLPFPIFRFIHPILRLNRLFRFTYILEYFKGQSQKLDIDLFGMYSLKTLLWLVLMLHLYTCVLIALSCTHTPNMQPEIVCVYNPDLFSSLKVYCRNLFVIFGCFICASQDLSYPDSLYLFVFFTFVMTSFKVISAIFISEIYSALQMVFTRSSIFSRHLEIITFLLQREDISKTILLKITNYLKLLWRYHMGSTFPTLLAEAPVYLREAVLNDAFAYHITDHAIFKKCHDDFHRQIVGYLRNTTYFRSNYVVFKGTIDGCMYFIHSGKIIVLDEDGNHNEILVTKLTKGMAFGIPQGLNIVQPHAYSFRAIKPTVILALDFNAWKHLLEFYPASKIMIFEQFSNYTEPYEIK